MRPAEKGFHYVDYAVLILVPAVSLGIGLYHAFTGGKQKTTKEYFMANHKLKTLPVAMSILVSFVSAILVLGTPAEMYTSEGKALEAQTGQYYFFIVGREPEPKRHRGTLLTMRVIGYCFACVLSSLLFVPLFFSIKVTSSFEYLERRFNSKAVKLMGSVMMLIGNIFYMGLLMYTPSTALEAVTDLPLWATIIATGVISTVYTTLGGMKAVIWTDVFQAIVMIGGMLAIVISGVIKLGGFTKMWTVSQQGGRLVFFNFDLDPTERLTTWSLVIGGMFSTLTIFGIGQTSVQRYCALPTLAQAKRSVYLNIPGLLIVTSLASLVGLVVYAYYASAGCDPLRGGYISNANQIVPYFVIDVLNYPGFPGVFLAVLFSGAMSSMSSSLNACAAVTWEDMMKPCFKHVKQNNKVFLSKCLVVLYGGLSMVVAFMADSIGGHVLWASLSFTGATTGPGLGMFMLGAFFPSANALGAVVGCLVSLAFSLWLALGSFINKPHSVTLPTSTENCWQNVTQGSGAHSNGLSDTNAGYYGITTSQNVTEMSGAWEVTHNVMNSVINTTQEAVTTGRQLEGLERFYALSFLWYSAFGCIICVAVGWIVSRMTASRCHHDYEASLVVPLGERLCCCLPETWRRKLCCNPWQHSFDLTSGDAMEEKSVLSNSDLKPLSADVSHDTVHIGPVKEPCLRSSHNDLDNDCRDYKSSNRDHITNCQSESETRS